MLWYQFICYMTKNKKRWWKKREEKTCPVYPLWNPDSFFTLHLITTSRWCLMPCHFFFLALSLFSVTSCLTWSFLWQPRNRINKMPVAQYGASIYTWEIWRGSRAIFWTCMITVYCLMPLLQLYNKKDTIFIFLCAANLWVKLILGSMPCNQC